MVYADASSSPGIIILLVGGLLFWMAANRKAQSDAWSSVDCFYIPACKSSCRS